MSEVHIVHDWREMDEDGRKSLRVEHGNEGRAKNASDPSCNISKHSTSPDQTRRTSQHLPDVLHQHSLESSPLTPLLANSRKMRIIGMLKTAIRLFFPCWTFGKFFVYASIPPLADNLIPLFFIGNIPNESALALAGQFTFISVIVEVIQEGIVNSLFYYVGRDYTVERKQSLQALKICLSILAVLGLILTGILALLSSQFVDLIDTPKAIAEATRTFLYTSSFSFPLLLVNAGLSNFLLITTSTFLIGAQLSSVTLSFLCNFLLFGQQNLSLHWNIEQLGYYKIIQASLSCLNNFIFMLLIERLGPFEFIFGIPISGQLRTKFKDLWKVSWGNFGDSAVRNFFYFVVTLKFINNLGETEIAAWNLLNTIIWGLLLIPSFTVANYAKVKIGHHGTKPVIRRVAMKCVKCLIAWLVVVATLAMLYWPKLAKFFGKSNQSAQVLSTKLFHEMGWIFVVFSFNNTMDSLFLGVGKTEYVFYQSLLTNLVVYFVPWILFLFDIITPTYWVVVGLYLAGMMIDFSLTTYFCIKVWDNIPD